MSEIKSLEELQKTKLYTRGLNYGKLTKKQKEYFDKYIWNGVGSSEYTINPRDFIFGEASKWHDCFFWVGGKDDRRLLADQDFFDRGLLAVNEHSGVKKAFYRAILSLYYIFLKALSKKAWEERKAPISKWADLVIAVREQKKDIPEYK